LTKLVNGRPLKAISHCWRMRIVKYQSTLNKCGLKTSRSLRSMYSKWRRQVKSYINAGVRVSTYVRLHRSWTSPDSSTSRVHRRLVTALRPRQEVPTHSQALPVTGEVFEPHGELPPSSARTRCTYPSSYPSSEVFSLCPHLTARAPVNRGLSYNLYKLIYFETAANGEQLSCCIAWEHSSSRLAT
jgi:hypothetical protein